MTNQNQMTAQEINAMRQLMTDIQETIQDYGVMEVSVDQGQGISINFSKMEEHELLECKRTLNAVLADHTTPFKKKQSAIASLTQVEGLLDVFYIVKEVGLDPSGMTAAEVVMAGSGKPIRYWNKTKFTEYFVVDSDALKGSVAKVKESTLSTTNKFANWLASKTQS